MPIQDYGNYPEDTILSVTVNIPPSLDQSNDNANWPKKTWDLLGIDDIDKLRAWLARSGQTAEAFKQGPLYRWNVDKMPWLKEL